MMQKFLDRICRWLGYVAIFGLPASVIVWIWTGDWRPAASVAVIMLALFLLAFGTKLVIDDERGAA